MKLWEEDAEERSESWEWPGQIGPVEGCEQCRNLTRGVEAWFGKRGDRECVAGEGIPTAGLRVRRDSAKAAVLLLEP